MSTRALASLLLFSLLALGGCTAPDSMPTVAVLVPLSGPHAETGEAVRRGAELEMARLRSEHGDAQVRLEIVDTAGNAARAETLAEGLADEGTVAFVGGVTRDEAEAIARVARENERVFVSVSPDSVPSQRLSFRLVPSSDGAAIALAGFAARAMDRGKVVVVHPSGPESETVDAFARELERNGLEVAARVAYGPVLADPEPVLREILASDPRVVFVSGPGGSVTRLIEGLAERRYRGSVLTPSLLAGEAVGSEIRRKGRPTVLLARAPIELGDEDPVVSEFVRRYREAHEGEPGLYAAYGADAMRALQAGWSHPEGGTRPEKLWRGIRFTTDLRGVTGPLQFDESGEVTVYPRVYRIDGGEQVRLDEIQLAARREAERASRS